MKIQGLKFVRTTSWSSIYRRWYQQEGQRSDWRRHYHQRGFATWGSWRQAVITQPFRLAEKKNWSLYQVNDFSKMLQWHGGPFPSWQRDYYRGSPTRSFQWLVQDKKISRNKKVLSIKKIPKKIFLFGVVVGRRVVVIDGMHRVCAIALKLSKGEHPKVQVAIALAPTKFLPKLKRSQT